MEGQPLGWLIPPLFILAFAGVWWLVTRLLLSLAGWNQLERRYPDRNEVPLERYRFRSGTMGNLLPQPFGVGFGNCLTIDVCHSGLRISVMCIFRLSSRPFLVPWDAITVTERRWLFLPRTLLVFGQPEVGRLEVSRRLGRALIRESRGRLAITPAP